MNNRNLADILYNAIDKINKIEDRYDVQMAHIYADKALVGVIEAILDESNDETVKIYAEELLREYKDVPKWYE